MSVSALLGAWFAVFSMKISSSKEELWNFRNASLLLPMYALIMPGLASIIVRCVPKCVPTITG